MAPKDRERREAAGVRLAPHRMSVGNDIRVQEEQVEPVELQQPQARLDRLAHRPIDPFGRRIAEIALARDPYPGGEPATERLADHAFRLAIPVARCEVEQGDTRV